MNFKEIQDIVEKKLNVDLFIKSRLRPLVEARFMYFLLCKEFSDEKTFRFQKACVFCMLFFFSFFFSCAFPEMVVGLQVEFDYV